MTNDSAPGQFGGDDPPFTEVVHRQGDDIPFATSLKQINQIHRKGLEIAEEDT